MVKHLRLSSHRKKLHAAMGKERDYVQGVRGANFREGRKTFAHTKKVFKK
jgi:hypothetical protein